MKNTKNKATVVKQRQNPRSITLTNFIKFALLADKKKLMHVKDSQKAINFATYWDPMRHAISRAHNSDFPDWGELITTTLQQKGNKLTDYITVQKNHVNMCNSQSIKGAKLKKLKSNIDLENLTIRLNPELSLLDDDVIHAIKFFYSKHVPLTELVAQQAIALMDIGLSPGTKAHYYVFDIYRGKIFEAKGLQKASLEKAALNSKAYISLVKSHIDTQTKSA